MLNSHRNISKKKRQGLATAMIDLRDCLVRQFGPIGELVFVSELRSSRSDLVTTQEAAKVLGLAPKTLENWRTSGKGPAFRKVGGKALYKVADLRKFVTRAKRSSTSDEGRAS